VVKAHSEPREVERRRSRGYSGLRRVPAAYDFDVRTYPDNVIVFASLA